MFAYVGRFYHIFMRIYSYVEQLKCELERSTAEKARATDEVDMLRIKMEKVNEKYEVKRIRHQKAIIMICISYALQPHREI